MNKRKLTAWYARDLTETYFSVIPCDILAIIKRCRSVYLSLDIEAFIEKPGKCRPYCFLSNCDCMPQLVGRFVDKRERFELTCVKCFNVNYTYNKMISCDKCEGQLFVGQDTYRKIVIYKGSKCGFSFVLDDPADSICLYDIWIGAKCHFIEKLNGKNNSKIINSHVFMFERMEEIESITTSDGIYELVYMKPKKNILMP